MKTTLTAVLLFLSIQVFSQSSSSGYYKIGKTHATITIYNEVAAGDLMGNIIWEDGTRTDLYLQQRFPTRYEIQEYQSDHGKYTGTLYMDKDLSAGTYLSNCLECNGKEYAVRIEK